MGLGKEFYTCDPVTSNHHGGLDIHKASLIMLNFITLTRCCVSVFSTVKLSFFPFCTLFFGSVVLLCFHFKMNESQNTQQYLYSHHSDLNVLKFRHFAPCFFFLHTLPLLALLIVKKKKPLR